MSWKVFECVANNAPNYFIVATRAFKGEVHGTFPTREWAESRAAMLNRAESAVQEMRALMGAN